jgi:hypothetical protein
MMHGVLRPSIATQFEPASARGFQTRASESCTAFRGACARSVMQTGRPSHAAFKPRRASMLADSPGRQERASPPRRPSRPQAGVIGGRRQQRSAERDRSAKEARGGICLFLPLFLVNQVHGRRRLGCFESPGPSVFPGYMGPAHASNAKPFGQPSNPVADEGPICTWKRLNQRTPRATARARLGCHSLDAIDPVLAGVFATPPPHGRAATTTGEA